MSLPFISIFLAFSLLYSICKSSAIKYKRIRSPFYSNVMHLTEAVLQVNLFKEVHIVIPDSAAYDEEISSLHENYSVIVTSFSSFANQTEERSTKCKSHRTVRSSYKVVLMFQPTEKATINLFYDSASLSSTIYILALNTNDINLYKRIKGIIRKAWINKYIFRVILINPTDSDIGKGEIMFDPFAKCKKNGHLVGLFRKLFEMNYTKLANYVTKKIKKINKCNKLKISMYPREGTAVLLTNNTFTGQDGKFIDLLSQMMNFTPSIKLTTSKLIYGYIMLNGTYKGTLVNLINGKAEISLNGHFMKDYNCDIIELSRQITNDKVCLLTPKAGVVPPLITVLKSFQLEVWAMIIISYILVVVSYNAWTYFGLLYVNQMSPKGCILALEIYRIMIASPLSRKSIQTCEKVLFTFCWFFSTVVLNSFQGSLVTFLNTPIYFPDINTFEDLLASGLPIKTSSYTFRDMLLGDPNLYKLGKQIQLTKPESKKFGGHFVGFQRINIYNLKYFKDIEYRKNEKESRVLHTMKQCLGSFFISYVLPKNSPYKWRIDDIISRVESSGLVIKWNRDATKYIFKKYKRHKKNRVHSRVFSLHDLEVAFFVLTFGLLCSTAVLIVEILTPKLHTFIRKKRKTFPVGDRQQKFSTVS